MMVRWMVVALATSFVWGCAGQDPASGNTTSAQARDEGRDDEHDTTRASREAAEPAPTEPVTDPQATPRLALVPVDVPEAEDGHGATVAAQDALAFDLDATQLPPRALDPVLLVGQLRFTSYTHPRVGTLRFVVADRAALTPGARVAVQYGDEPPVVVTESLVVP